MATHPDGEYENLMSYRIGGADRELVQWELEMRYSRALDREDDATAEAIEEEALILKSGLAKVATLEVDAKL